MQVEDLVVNVRPYDVHSGANVCTDELRLFDHRTTLTCARLRGRSSAQA